MQIIFFAGVTTKTFFSVLFALWPGVHGQRMSQSGCDITANPFLDLDNHIDLVQSHPASAEINETWP